MPTNTTTPTIADARDRLEQLAAGLCTKFDPLDVGGSFAAVAAGLLVERLGRDAAASYLQHLGAAIASDDHPSWGGRA